MAQFVSGVPTFFEVLQCLRMSLFFSHDALRLWFVLIHGGVGALNAQDKGQDHLSAKLACQPAQKPYLELGTVAGDGVIRSSQLLSPVSHGTPYGFNQPAAHPRSTGLPLRRGGPKVNTAARVPGLAGAPISGLYTAGEPMGEIFSYTYPGASSVIRGAVYGRIAGIEAARRAGEGRILRTMTSKHVWVTGSIVPHSIAVAVAFRVGADLPSRAGWQFHA